MAAKNESTRLLKGGNMFLVIQNDGNQNEMHHLQFKIGRSSFPINFTASKINEIKSTGFYLLSLLVFGNPHRLLWEKTLFRQHLVADQTNSITFIVNDVCK